MLLLHQFPILSLLLPLSQILVAQDLLVLHQVDLVLVSTQKVAEVHPLQVVLVVVHLVEVHPLQVVIVVLVEVRHPQGYLMVEMLQVVLVKTLQHNDKEKQHKEKQHKENDDKE